MTVNYAIYDLTTGVIARVGHCPDEATAQMQAAANEGYLLAPPDGVVADGLWSYVGGAYSQAPLPTLSLADQKVTALRSLGAVYNAKVVLWSGSGAPSGGLQVDESSMSRLTSWATQTLACKASGAAFGLLYWIMADNSHHTFTGPDDFLAFASAAAAYKTAVILNNSSLKAAIAAAPDEAALNAIDINGGWPA